MSYNGYNYSPYFQYTDQQPVNGQQQSYPHQRPGAGTSYRTHQAAPVNGYSSGQQQYSIGPSPSHSSSTTFAYPGYGRADDSSERTSRGDATSNPPAYFEPNARPYVDTSALGSLAYASALGRNSPSVEHTVTTQQLPTRSDPNGSPAYESNMSRPFNGSYQPRVDNRGSGTAPDNTYNRSVPYATAVAASALAQSQRQAPVRSENSTIPSPTQPSYSTQAQVGNGGGLRNGPPNQPHPSQQGYGTNGEGRDTPTTYARHQPLLSPSHQSLLRQPAQPSRHPISSEKRNSMSQQSSTRQSGNGSFDDRRLSSNIEQRIPSPHQNYYPPTHRPMSANEPMRNKGYNSPTASKRAEEVYSKNKTFTDSQQAVKAADRPPAVMNEKVNENVMIASPTNSDHPMTVNPNQVFNQYEYQKRQATAKARAKAMKDAAKDGSQRKVVDSNSLASKQPQPQTSLNDDSPTSMANSSKEKREAEIKATFGSLIGKMRDLKAEDPSMFSEIWEKFLKGQPPIRSNSQAPNAAKEPQSSTTNGVRAIEVNSLIVPEIGQMPSPSLIHNQPTLMAEVNENGPSEQLPDLGRFPAQRRRRKSKLDKESLKDGQSHPSGDIVEQRQSSEATVNRVNENKDSVPREALDRARVDPALSSCTSPLPHPSATLDTAKVLDSAQDIAAAESLRKAMQDFYHPVSQVVDQGRVTASRQGSSVNMQLHDAAGPQSLATPDARSTESPTLLQPLSGGTKWPEKSKPRLAAAAKDTLMSTAANTGKEISTEEIKAMLDQDPTYSQLCDILERKGFIVHRSHFAQRLLSAVPSVSPQASSPALAQDSPKRGRGRPRNDGLPPRRRQTTLNITQGTSTTLDGTAQSVPNQPATDRGTATKPLESNNSGVCAGGTPQTRSGPAHRRIDYTPGAPLESVKLFTPAVAIQEFPPAPPGYSAWRSHNSPQGATSSSLPLQRPEESAVREPTAAPAQGPKVPKSIKWADKRNVSQSSSTNHGNVDVQTGHLVRTPDSLIHKARDGSLYDPPTTSGRIYSEPQPKQGLTSAVSDLIRVQAHYSSPVPLTKAEMARKRSFNEIVDLTQDLSENDAIQKHKRARTTLYNSQPIGPDHTNLVTPVTSNASQVLELKSHEADNLGRSNPSTVNTDLSGSLSERKGMRSGDVVKPLEKKKALRRSAYNGKTIARDILISLGKHPTEKPLNWHLLALRDSFNVINASNLSSFRWDLADPGGPTPQASKSANLDGQDARDTADSEMINIGSEAQPSVRPEHTAAVVAGIDIDVNIMDQENNDIMQQAKGMSLRGRGRGLRSRGTIRVREVQPHQPPSQLPNEQIQPPGPTNKPSRGRGRGRPRGSRGVARGPLHRQPIQQPQMPPTPRLPASSLGIQSVVPQSTSQGTNAGGFQRQPHSNAGETQHRQASGPSGNVRTIDISQFAFRDGVATTEPSPSSSERHHSSIQVQLPIISRVAETPSVTPEKRRGRPPGSGKKQLNVENTISVDSSDAPKRRGRPLGPATALSLLEPPSPPTDGILIMVPSRSPSLALSAPSGTKRSGGLHETSKQKREKGKSRQPTSPSYPVYKCLWEGCQAELHNLETLRKHLYKLHCTQKAKGVLYCLWHRCDRLGVDGLATMIQNSQIRHAVFATEDEIKQHVEANHLQSLAWKLGDGPTAHPSDVEMSDYLSDAEGRQVTPLIREEGARETYSDSSTSSTPSPGGA